MQGEAKAIQSQSTLFLATLESLIGYCVWGSIYFHGWNMWEYVVQPHHGISLLTYHFGVADLLCLTAWVGVQTSALL